MYLKHIALLPFLSSAVFSLWSMPARSQDYASAALEVCSRYFQTAWTGNGSTWIALGVNGTEASGVRTQSSAQPLQEHDRLNGLMWTGMIMFQADAIRIGGGDWREGGPIFQCLATYSNDGWHGHYSDVLAGKITRY